MNTNEVLNKLIAEIERLNSLVPYESKDRHDEGLHDAYKAVKNAIISLQQEQLVNKVLGTLITCDIIEMTVKKAIDKPQDKEKEEELMTRKINYLRSLEENYVQQEQPEVDLEKEFESYMEKYNGVWVDTDYIKFARHFFELGLNARKED